MNFSYEFNHLCTSSHGINAGIFMMKTWRKIDFFRINLSIILAHEMEINISQTLRRLKLDQKLTSIRLAASFFPLTLISLFFVYSKIKPNIRKLIP